MAIRRKKPKNVVKTRKEMRKDLRKEKKSKQKEFLKIRRENKLKKKGEPKSRESEPARKFDLKKKRPFKKETNGKLKEEVTKKAKKPQKTPLVISPKLLEIDPDASDFEDEEIDSDELSGAESDNEEVPNYTPVFEDKMTKAREREANKLQKYEDGLKQRRIEQLEQANEEEDKVISKYEKLLKLNKRKGKKDALTSFNDGLDYILELCTKDSIEKMYNAAKEAAELENEDEDSDDEVMEVLKKKGKSKKNETKKDKTNERLRKIEEKYFGEDKEPETIALEDLIGDSDDSELNEDDFEHDQPAPKKSKTDKKVTFKDQKGVKEEDSDGNSDFDILDSDASDVSEEESEENDEDLAELFKNKKQKNYVMAPQDTDNENEALSNEDQQDSDDELAELFKNKKSSNKAPKIHEDIYGRKRDAKGNIIVEESSAESKYIPPHLRAKSSSDAVDPKKQEQLDRLKKQLKGQINRLAESNIQRIAIDVENLYMQHARYDMNTTLTDLIISALVSNVLAKERMVLEHMLLVATLHANIGSEIGAFFLEQIIQKFNGMLEKLESLLVEDKTLDNYIFMLCHMYSFKLFHHNLIYNILDKLCGMFNEKSVDCILLVLRSIGFQLRKDDPLALKDLILKIQKMANDASKDLQNDVRVKFMLDILLAIKNNNMTKIPNYDPSLGEHFKKLLKSLTHEGKHVATLNITMDDLLNVDKRGKWWLVGSAWAGNELKGERSARVVSSEGEFSAQLLELASKQRMNTDDRRKSFCIIMSAEDYMDAFEKLMHLSIKDPRVIITVIIHCCLSEKQFNPYYAVLAQKFCDTDRKYQLAVQYALWDRIRELSCLTPTNIKNLGQFIIYIIQQGGQPLSVLKVVDFAELDKVTHKFVKQIVTQLLLVPKDEIFSNIFGKVALSKKLNSFRDSIKLFMHHFLLSPSNKKKLDEETSSLLEHRIELIDQLFQSTFATF